MRRGRASVEWHWWTHIELDGIALCKAFAKMHIGVLKGMSVELLAPYEGDERWADLEVVSLNHRANNGGGNS